LPIRIVGAIGFTYGLALVILAGMAAGFGEGLFAPLALVSSPFSLIGVRTAFAASPFLWALIGFLLSLRDWKTTFIAIAVLVLSYCGAAVVLHSANNSFADYDRWSRLPDSIRTLSKITVSLYLVGQFAIWCRIASDTFRSRTGQGLSMCL
jgi:hypothetical protein